MCVCVCVCVGVYVFKSLWYFFVWPYMSHGKMHQNKQRMPVWKEKKEIELKINYLPLNVMADVFGIEMKECYCYAQLVTPEASI
jgi:hypothetical protein